MVDGKQIHPSKYIDIEDVFGNKTIYVYFASAIDKENFYHYYNMQSGIEEIRK